MICAGAGLPPPCRLFTLARTDVEEGRLRISAFALVAAAAFVLASPVGAQTQAPASGQPAPQQTAAPQENPDEIICKEGTPVTGSRLGARKICHTRRQWDEISQNSRDITKDAQDRALTSRPPGS